MREAFSQEQGNCEFGCLFYRPFDFKRVGFFSCVCIDIEGAPEVCSGLVGRVKIDANIRRLAFGQQRLPTQYLIPLATANIVTTTEDSELFYIIHFRHISLILDIFSAFAVE